jgi:hypothetical protein
MSAMKDPFEVLFVRDETRGEATTRTNLAGLAPPRPATPSGAAIARLHGFALDDQPLVAGLADLPGETVAARSTVPLVRSQIGSAVVVVFAAGDVRRPIVLGVLQDRRVRATAAEGPAPVVSAQVDDDEVVVSAERQVTLRCGEASITLTRAGKVIIKGKYVISRSSGCNKIKGAIVDIN